MNLRLTGHARAVLAAAEEESVWRDLELSVTVVDAIGSSSPVYGVN